MTTQEIVSAIILVITTIVSSTAAATFITQWFARRKAKAKAEQIVAETEKTEAETELRKAQIQRRVLEIAQSTIDQSLQDMQGKFDKSQSECERLRVINRSQAADIQTLIAANERLQSMYANAQKENERLRANEERSQARIVYLEDKVRQLETTLSRLETKPFSRQ